MGQEPSKPMSRHGSQKQIRATPHPTTQQVFNLETVQGIKLELKPQTFRPASSHQMSTKATIKVDTTTKLDPEQQSTQSLASQLRLNIRGAREPSKNQKSTFTTQSEMDPLGNITQLSQISGIQHHSTLQEMQSPQQLEVKRQPTLNYIKEMKKRSGESDQVLSRDATQSFQTKTPLGNITNNIFSSARSSVTHFQMNQVISIDNSHIIDNQMQLPEDEIGRSQQDEIYQCYVRNQQQRQSQSSQENSTYMRTNQKKSSFISQESKKSKFEQSNQCSGQYFTQMTQDNSYFQSNAQRKVNNHPPKQYSSQNVTERQMRTTTNNVSEHTPNQNWSQMEQPQCNHSNQDIIMHIETTKGHPSMVSSPSNKNNYVKLPFLQFQDGYNVYSQFNQLNQEKKDLQGMTEQQKLIINQQYQLLVQLTQIQSNNQNQNQNHEKQAPIIINNNILSPDVYKREANNQQNQLKEEIIYQNKIPEKIPQEEIQCPPVNQVPIIQKVLTELKNKTPLKSSGKKVQSQKVSPISNRSQKLTPLRGEQRSNQIHINDDKSNREPTQIKKGIKLDFNFDSENKQTNLADCFKARKKTQLQSNERKNDLILKSLSMNPSKKTLKVEQIEEVEKREEWVINVNRRSREDQIKLRKEMMNYGKSVRQNHRVSKEEISVPEIEIKPKRLRMESPVLERLAMGVKLKVPEKEMYALTKKNYENLPEVKQKRSNAQIQLEKNDFLQDRKSKIKNLERETRNRLFKKKDTD